MTKYFKIAAVIALAAIISGCKKDNGGDEATGANATISVSLDGVKNSWSKGDKFTIFSESGASQTATLSKSGKTAAFTTADKISGKIFGVYPEGGATFADGKLSVTIPTEQEFGKDYFILAGNGNVQDGMNFSTPFAALLVKVSGSCVLSSLDVTADKPIAGAASIDMNAASLAAVATADKTVSLKNINATVSGDAVFAIAVAPGTYSSLKVVLHDADSNTKTLDMSSVTLAPGAGVEAAISHVAPINLSAAGNANCFVVPGAGDYKFACKKPDGTAVSGQAAAYVWTYVEYEYNTGENNLKEITQMKGTPDPEWIVKNISYDKSSGTISFTATGNKGNALIALYNEAGEDVEAVWSWHIWSTGKTLEQMTMTDWQTKNLVACNSKTSWLTMNLGALEDSNWNSAEIYGLLYQWGRKDPFPGSRMLGSQATGGADTGGIPFGDAGMPILVNSLFGIGFEPTTALVSMEETAKHPLHYPNTANYWCTDPENVNWGDGYQKFTDDYIAPYLTDQDPTWNYTDGPRNADFAKSNNDPCPAGYRVPTIEQLVLSFAMWVADASTVGGKVYNFTEHWGDNLTSERSEISYTRRITSYTDESKKMLYPCSGYREASGKLVNAGKSNYYPSATRKTNANTYYRTIVGTNLRVDTAAGSYSIARNIRCIKAD